MFRVWHLTEPLVTRAMVEVYAKAKAEMPDDDEGKMIEIVSKPKRVK